MIEQALRHLRGCGLKNGIRTTLTGFLANYGDNFTMTSPLEQRIGFVDGRLQRQAGGAGTRNTASAATPLLPLLSAALRQKRDGSWVLVFVALLSCCQERR